MIKQYQNKDWLKHQLKTKTRQEIAWEQKCHIGTIVYWCKKHKIKHRNIAIHKTSLKKVYIALGSSRKTAEHFHVSFTTIFKELRRHGIPILPSGGCNKPCIVKNKILEAYSPDLTPREICEIVGTSIYYVHQVLSKNGLPKKKGYAKVRKDAVYGDDYWAEHRMGR